MGSPTTTGRRVFHHKRSRRGLARGEAFRAYVVAYADDFVILSRGHLALAAATSITVSLLAAPPAEARCWGCAVGVGVAAGVVTGAIVGSAIANSYGPAYVVQPGYTAYPSYAVAAPVGRPGGYWARRPVAFDAYGNAIGWSRPRYFCP